MQPEILHRCSSCGAAIRDFEAGVLFCPECGKALAPKNHESKRETQGKTAADDGPHEPAPVTAVVPDQPKAHTNVKHENKSTEPDAARQSTRERTREKLQRASTAARGAIEDNVKRVEKIHHVSTVMFEEAHYDPSLRFVLVAVGIFVLFIILLVLSKVMG